MSDTVKYSDELLTSDEFIKIANENNDKNLQLQKDQAKKVYENTYASLERQYNETATSAGVAKERNLVDADTAYKLNDVKYGDEAEAMGRMGLTGSGMGEYREAQAYAQNRADRQATYAEYDRVMREAAYNRDQGKLDAEVKYSDAVTNAEINHNNTATAISEKELGYAEGERAAIDASYSAFIDGINNGTMTIDEIKADSYWSKMSAEQQAQVESAWTVKGFKNSIDNGTYADEEALTSSEEFAALTDSERSAVKGYFAEVQAGKKADAGAAATDYITMALNGYSIDAITTAAKGNGHYDVLVESGLWQNIVNEVEKFEADKASDERGENYSSLYNSAANGTSIDAIMQDERWKTLTPQQQAQVRTIAQEYSDRQQAEKVENETAINETNYTSWLAAIKTGTYTLKEIQGLSGYNDLTGEQKAALLAAEEERAAKARLGNQTERADRIVSYGDLARSGTGLEELKNIMALYGDDWDSLSDTERAVITQAAKAYTDAQAAMNSGERANQIAGLADLAAQGYSLEEIQAWAELYGITELSENELAVINNSISRYTDAQKAMNSENERERAYGYAGLIEAGWSLDEVKALIGEEAYKALSDESKRIIETTASVIERAKTDTAKKEAAAALVDYADMAISGVSFGTIEAIARANGHYDILNTIGADGKSQWDSVKSEADKTNIKNAIANGATLEDVQKMDGWNELGETEQNAYKEAIEATANETEQTALLNLPSYLSCAEIGYSFDDIKRLAGADYDTLVKLGKWDAVVEATALYEYENAEINDLKDLNTLLKDYPENVRDKFVSAFSEENRKLLYEELVDNESLQGVLRGTDKSSDEILYNIEKNVDVLITNEDRWKLFEDAVDHLISKFEASMNGGLTAAHKVVLEEIITHLEDKGCISAAYAAKIYELTSFEPAPEPPSSNWNMTGGNLFVM